MTEVIFSSASGISHLATLEENIIKNEPKHRISKRDLFEEDETQTILESIDAVSQQYENNRQPKSDNTVVEEERLAASDINWGVTIIGNSIRFISAIFTIIGGDSIDRVDGYDTAVSSFFTLAGSVLKYFSGQLLSNEASSPLSKIDISNLSEEELLQKQQLAAYIANLSPDEIKNKQDLVLQHVQQEAIKNGLSEIEAQKLLVETLQGNGLPLIDGLDPSVTGQVDLLAPLASVAGLFAGVGETLSSLLGTNIEKTEYTEEEIPGLPTPGTLNYAVTMALFKASESVNGFLNGLTGGGQIQQVNVPNNKIDQDLQSSSDTSIFSKIASFLPGSQSVPISLDPSTSGALTNLAVSPAIIGLGLVATGLLGGVAYASSSNRRSDLVTSASSLAKGAVDAIRNNPLVKKVEETVLEFTGTNPYADKKDKADPYVFYPDYGQGYNGQYSYQGYEDPRVENYERIVEYPDYEYVDPREQVRAPPQPYYEAYQPETSASDEGEVRESFTLADASQHKIDQAIPDHVVFYEPDTKVEVVTYNEEHNPWEYLHNGQSTDHLYSRGFKR